METAYALVLQCELPFFQTDEEGNRQIIRYDELAIAFDVIKSTSTNLSSDVTTHPLVNGDSMADHMYKTPISMSVSGAFSLYGNKPTVFAGESSDRLTNIEHLFERIKNEAIHCTLTRFASGLNSSVRFIQRKNMVLTNISWVEEAAYLGFDFSFTEAMTADIQEVTYEEDKSDPNLPALTDAQTLDFTDTLLDWNEVDRVVCSMANEIGIVAEDFWDVVVDVSKSITVGSAVGAGIGVAAGVGVCLAIGLSSLSVPVVGWIVAGAAAIGCVIGWLVGLFQSISREEQRRRYRVETFKNYHDDEKNRQEVDRFCNWIGQIHMNLETLEDVLHLYGIGSNEPQECMLYIDDDYYIFKFEYNNVEQCWSMVVTNTNNKKVTSMDRMVGHADLSECNSDSTSYLFRVPGTGAYVYLMNIKLASMLANGDSQEAMDEAARDLTNYAILKSDIDMDKFSEVLKQLIDDAMTM